jgi:acetylornithine aminotransferase
MEEDGLLAHAAAMGERIRAGLAAGLDGLTGVREIRGHGLMIGVELDRPCGVLLTRAADAGLLISVTADSVVRLLPPLVISAAEVDELLSILLPLMRDFLAAPAA